MGHESTFDRQQALAAMLTHAARHSPYYRGQGWATRLQQGKRIDLGEIPVTPKSLVRTETERFFSTFVPHGEGAVQSKYTSGSTGEPMAVRKTQRHFRINLEESRRLLRGWGLGDHRHFVQIELPVDDHPAGSIEKKVAPAGGQQWKLYSVDSFAIFDLLRHTGASLVHGLPSLCLGALEHGVGATDPLALRLVWAIGEVIPDQLRELIRQLPDCRLFDTYGCVEAGLIAALCPQCGAYHVADRHLILEVVTDDGRPAEPGQMGRVVLTPLFNRAMPLVRYEMGDYAVLAARRDCPRSPLGLARIVGRERELFKLPDGRKIMPRLPIHVAHRLALRKFKLVQTTLTDIEMLYVPQDDGVEISRNMAQDIVDRFMSPGFRVHPRRVSEIPRARGGKYLMHECLV